jgi:hypothetical protein
MLAANISCGGGIHPFIGHITPEDWKDPGKWFL